MSLDDEAGYIHLPESGAYIEASLAAPDLRTVSNENNKKYNTH